MDMHPSFKDRDAMDAVKQYLIAFLRETCLDMIVDGEETGGFTGFSKGVLKEIPKANDL